MSTLMGESNDSHSNQKERTAPVLYKQVELRMLRPSMVLWHMGPPIRPPRCDLPLRLVLSYLHLQRHRAVLHCSDMFQAQKREAHAVRRAEQLARAPRPRLRGAVVDFGTLCPDVEFCWEGGEG